MKIRFITYQRKMYPGGQEVSTLVGRRRQVLGRWPVAGPRLQPVA